MELLAEIIFELYGELMFLIIPEKNASKKYILLSKVIAILVFLGVIALGIFGVFLISDKKTLLGIIPIAVAAIISLAQIIAGIILFKKHH